MFLLKCFFKCFILWSTVDLPPRFSILSKRLLHRLCCDATNLSLNELGPNSSLIQNPQVSRLTDCYVLVILITIVLELHK